ncbi:MAG TPA: ComEC/Rec2 family competence protein, partial [Thermomicrobiales bacterium]|nr:ComEC/Rec2 family competence protein [Thermomicrobiales bacterium]
DQRGAGWMRYLTAARRAISHRLQEAIPGDAGALAAGIVTGDDSALSDEARLWFRQTGTTHVTAVSGQNVALLVGFLAIWLPPRRRSTRWLAHGVMISSIWLYVGMVGLEAPALRAAIVATLMMLGSWFGRRPDPVTILALTLGAMALLDPGMTHQVGFLLSAAASWALCAAMPVRERPPVLRGLADVFSAVMAANIATLPILLWTFGEWSPISLLANVLLGPVMTVAFPASYLLVAIGIPLPGLLPWLAWIPAIPLDLSLAIVHRLSGVLPLLHMPVAGASVVALISLPCFGALLLLSQDGDRWRQRISRGWRESDVAVRQVLAGSLVASVVAVAGLMFLGR